MMGVLLLSASTTSLREPTSLQPIPAVVVNHDVPFTLQLGKEGSGLCGANMAPYSLDSGQSPVTQNTLFPQAIHSLIFYTISGLHRIPDSY